jgi:large subunit ribosomal protein L22
MRYRYSVETDKPELVKALGKSLAISTKQSIEICSFIRRKRVAEAKEMLDRVIEQKQAVPYRRFHGDTGHKTGIGPGRYPIKACKEVRELLGKVEASASQKGLGVDSLVITHVSAQKGGKQFHYGRQRRRMMKRTHIEVVAEAVGEEKAHAKKEKESKHKEESLGKAEGQEPKTAKK